MAVVWKRGGVQLGLVFDPCLTILPASLPALRFPLSSLRVSPLFYKLDHGRCGEQSAGRFCELVWVVLRDVGLTVVLGQEN